MMQDKLRVIMQKIDEKMNKCEHLLIAVDGNCAAGKSTIAAKLFEIYDCNVFHMDDFFLRPKQRTPRRFAQTGGNIDYERFLSQVLTPLRKGEEFSYSPFNCTTLTMDEAIRMPVKRVNIIEGVYSLHPYFENPYDLKFFLTVSPQLQKKRILQRPAGLHERFFNEWIPMENRYFDEFGIRETAIVL